MSLLLLLVTLTACAAAPQDLSGKMFIFPQETNTAHVRVATSTSAFAAATVCHRTFTDLKRDHSLFSLATRTNQNAFLVFKPGNVIRIHAGGKSANYGSLDYPLNQWISICTTWDSASGLVQLWVDGKPSIKRYLGGAEIGAHIVVLGQEQDSFGGGFDAKQSFLGMMSDVHMWDHVLSSCEIQRFVQNLNFTPGNIINWASLDFSITGRVLIEDKQEPCLH